MDKYDANKLEKEIAEFWDKNHIHKKSGKKGRKFYFLDGPPYTSGKVHIGTAWNKALKDCVLRHRRMMGFDVWDRAGYDMHGLPNERAVQGRLGLKAKEDIVGFGVAKFVEECQRFAVSNMRAMNNDFRQLGIWMDFENAYQTLSQEYIDGVWWLVKQADKNRRLYEGLRTMTWCANCGTALAKHELDYESVSDNSIFVKFRVKGKKNEFLVVWTTTPWTIPFNLAVMVNPELDYVRAEVGGEVWILAAALAAPVIRGVADREFKVIEEFRGEKLDNLAYEHPFSGFIDDYRKLSSKSRRVHTVVLSREHVNLDAGTGLVHCAPGCGPEDYEVGYKHGLPPYNSLSEAGVFPKSAGRFSGLTAKKDDKKFVDALRETNALIAESPVEHEYAHCWRCKSPVIYRTTKQWFFRVEDLKEDMLALNKEIFWQPEFAGSRQFDSWLNNLRDNSITKQRFWGTPLPVWRCKKCKAHVVVGSSAELKKLAKKLPKNLHKPWIDDVRFKCSKCSGVMERIPDIIDVWVDAGSASWNCLYYPQKSAFFRKYFPADFILEGYDQIRGWFNMLLVASMVSMRRPCFRAVYMHGFVNDAQGRKMSKSLGNYILPSEVIDKYGADAFRLYSIGGAQPGIDLNYNFEDVKTKYRSIVVLWNIHNYLVGCARDMKANPKKLRLGRKGVEERFILSKLNSVIQEVTALFGNYQLNEVPWKIEDLFLELSRTYIKFTREKATAGSEPEKKAVLAVIYRVLLECLKLSAPVIPFVTEKIYQNLKKEFGLKQESIHLFKWPVADKKLINAGLEEDVETAKELIQSMLYLREKLSCGVRWPLKEAVVVAKDGKTAGSIKKLVSLIKAQANIKELIITNRFDKAKTSMRLNCDALKVGFADKLPAIIARFSNIDSKAALKHIEAEGKFGVDVDGEKIELRDRHFLISKEAEGYEHARFSHGDVFLNRSSTPELEAEGFSRELTRRIQDMRKKSGMQKSERIDLFVRTDAVEMLRKFEKQVMEKVGAEKITLSDGPAKKKFSTSGKEKIRGKSIEILFNRV